jgi:hypothetical protein
MMDVIEYPTDSESDISDEDVKGGEVVDSHVTSAVATLLSQARHSSSTVVGSEAYGANAQDEDDDDEDDDIDDDEEGCSESEVVNAGDTTTLDSDDDDFEDFRTYHFGESNFTVPKRYVVKDMVGKGAYGIVW